mmetsp:Transcript_68204/g.142531  ORF Transcript_68204/g.142531 Transcript_68204/m.142531 type:complete len:310 (+) Transcript_68204:693-1622(+)
MLCFLVFAQLRRLGLGILDLLDGLSEVFDLHVQLGSQCLQGCHLRVQRTHFLRGIVPLLLSHGEGLVAPALLRGLVSGLLLQALNELLNQHLDLSKGVLTDLTGQGGEHCALQFESLGPQERLDRMSANILRRGDLVPCRQGQESRSLLHHGFDRFHGLRAASHFPSEAQAHTLLRKSDGRSRGLVADCGLHDADGLSQDLEFISPHLRSLIPSSGLVRAHFGKTIGVLFVVHQNRGHGAQPGARAPQVGDGLSLVLLCRLHLRGLLLDGVMLLLQELLMQIHCLHFGRIDLVALRSEVLEKALERGDD